MARGHAAAPAPSPAISISLGGDSGTRWQVTGAASAGGERRTRGWGRATRTHGQRAARGHSQCHPPQRFGDNAEVASTSVAPVSSIGSSSPVSPKNTVGVHPLIPLTAKAQGTHGGQAPAPPQKRGNQGDF